MARIRKSVFWCGVFFLWIAAVPILGMVLTSIVRYYAGFNNAGYYVATVVVSGILQALGILACRKLARVRVLGDSVPGSDGVLAGLCTGVFGYIPLMVVSALCSMMFPGASGGSDLILQMGLVPALISIALVPAIMEELICRGVIFGIFRPAGFGPALFWSAACFGLLHGNLGSILYAFIFGLVVGYLRERTGSVVPGMLAHGTINAITVCRIFHGPENWALSDVLFLLEIVISTVFLFISFRLLSKKRDSGTVTDPSFGRLDHAVFFVFFLAVCVFGFFF